MYCPHCDALNADSANRCSSCGAALTPKTTVAAYHPTENVTVPQKPMKWYYFLIYVDLFFNAVLHLVTAVAAPFLLQLYDIYTPGAILCTIITTAPSLAMCAYVLVVRSFLANYRRRGPMLYYIYLVADALIPLLILLLNALLCPALNQDATLSISLLNLITLALNYTYFDKRRAYFIY